MPRSLSDESMQMIVNETNRLDGLVKRLLYFSRPISPTLQPVKINDLLSHTILFIQTSTKLHKLKILTEVEETLPSIMADPNSLEQVFINIIMNAIEANTGQDSITIKTDFKSANHCIQIHIEDSGEGIPKENHLKIFDPFFTTKDKGFGLGLSISYEIISAHKGSIHFKGNHPRGTICTIQIPINNNINKKVDDAA